MVHVGAGKIAGTVGMANMQLDPPLYRPPTLQELKLRWIDRLEERIKGKSRTWATALKDCWIAAVGVFAPGVTTTPPATLLHFKLMIQRTGNCFDQVEGMRLYRAWASADGTLSFETVLADLRGALQPERPIFALHAIHGSFDTKPVIPGLFGKSNIESHENSLSFENIKCSARVSHDTDEPVLTWLCPAPSLTVSCTDAPIAQLLPVPRAEQAALEAAARSPPKGFVANAPSESLPRAGVAQVTGGVINNGSSVPGGIFGEDFHRPQPTSYKGEPIEVKPRPGERGRNGPSIAGGIFQMQELEQLPARAVPMPIWGRGWGDERANTSDYGQNNFPRKGLDVLNAKRVHGFDPMKH